MKKIFLALSLLFSLEASIAIAANSKQTVSTTKSNFFADLDDHMRSEIQEKADAALSAVIAGGYFQHTTLHSQPIIEPGPLQPIAKKQTSASKERYTQKSNWYYKPQLILNTHVSQPEESKTEPHYYKIIPPVLTNANQS